MVRAVSRRSRAVAASVIFSVRLLTRDFWLSISRVMDPVTDVVEVTTASRRAAKAATWAMTSCAESEDRAAVSFASSKEYVPVRVS